MLARDTTPIRQLTGDELSLLAPHEAWERTIRALRRGEIVDFEAHLLRLDADSRRARFGTPVSDAYLADYAAGTGQPGTQVRASLPDGRIRGAVEMRLLPSNWCREAELALSVETAWQMRGIGTALLAAAVRAAREHDIERLYISCHAESRLRIVERLAGKVISEDCECFADIDVRWQGAVPGLRQGAGRAGAARRVLALDM